MQNGTCQQTPPVFLSLQFSLTRWYPWIHANSRFYVGCSQENDSTPDSCVAIPCRVARFSLQQTPIEHTNHLNICHHQLKPCFLEMHQLAIFITLSVNHALLQASLFRCSENFVPVMRFYLIMGMTAISNQLYF